MILVAYNAQDDCAYWLYLQVYFQAQSTFDLFTAPRQLTVRMPKSQRLNRRAIRKFCGFREKSIRNLWAPLSTMIETFQLTRTFTYGQLHKLLRDLGFGEHRVTIEPQREGHVFIHPDCDQHFIALAVHGEDEIALPHDVAYIRRMLDSWRFMGTDQFDRWMVEQEQEHSKAS